jgi:glycosyltransferase involved in cell wall biosynthesis
MSGMTRKIFRTIEKMVCRNSTHIRSVSPMNRAFGIEEKLYGPEKVKVVGNGGTIGVSLEDYDISQKAQWRKAVRTEYKISESDMVFGFAGRVSADKGCGELLQAFRQVAENDKNAKLMVVGPVEDHCGIDAALLQWAKEASQVVFTGKVNNADMKRFYAAMDVLVHPSYREGFGMVIQEAGALAVPVITTRIPGASEVMVEGTSCLLVEPKNAEELATAMGKVCTGEIDVARLGQAAYERTKTLYARPVMLENQRKDYESLLEHT